MQSERHVRLFRNGRNQELRIPREFELEGDRMRDYHRNHRDIFTMPTTKSLTAALKAGR